MMKKENNKVNWWLVTGVVIAAILLMIWLFVGTTLEEDVTPVAQPPSMGQNG